MRITNKSGKVRAFKDFYEARSSGGRVLNVIRETKTQVICQDDEWKRERRFSKITGKEVNGYLGRAYAQDELAQESASDANYRDTVEAASATAGDVL